MATRITDVSQIPYNSSGVYFREVDLTVVTKATGGFSAASIGLTEKGPAFEISNSATYSDRAFRLGELNPNFPSSYYAKQYLEQARNFKEVRILGLEGYKDTRGFAISYDISGTVAANPGVSSLKIGIGGLVAVLKERPTSMTGRPSITSVEVQAATYTDPGSGLPISAATDYLFDLVINYADSTTDTITCSLRPESKEYIVKKLWTLPFEKGNTEQNIYPLIKNQICPLWVDFIMPSVQTRPSLDKAYGYYVPGGTVPQTSVSLAVGNMNFGTNFTYASATITNVVPKVSSNVVIGTTVTVTGDITGFWSSGTKAMTITGVTGTGNVIAANGTWVIDNLTFSSGSSTFDLYDYDSATKKTNPTMVPFASITTTSVFSSANSPVAAKYEIPTWETEVLDFSAVFYQTPITPWFVSDGDANGDYRKLFRLWSISDGKKANTETKIEVRNIDPSGNNGKGTFDIVVRKFDDRDDLENIRLESFANLNLDPTSDNYVVRRIGDGEDFPLKSRFIFIELNGNETIPDDSLPYGVLGYPNVTGNKFIDMQWTLAYDQTRPITKQSLGIANNKINAFQPIPDDLLSFKNSTGTIGKGFHLNPKNNTTFATVQSTTFQFADQGIYLDSIKNVSIVPQEKVRRSKYVTCFYGGFDGWNVYSNRTWSDPTSQDYAALQMGLSQLSDKENIDADFTVLVTPDFYLDTDAEACEAVHDMVVARGDALYIPDLSYDALADSQAAADTVTASNLLSSYAAIYFPWLQISDPINKVNQWLPPSILALGTITYTAMNENVWQPPGGSIRTDVNNLVRSRRRLKIDDREILKKGLINPITLFPGTGYEITEVRTTQPTFSALSFIHNRLLLCYAKKTLNQVLRPLLFQLNGEITKDAFLSTVRPIFDRIKKLNGVEEYAVDIVDHPELNDRTTIYGRISIVPLYAVERIIIDFNIADDSVNFTSNS